MVAPNDPRYTDLIGPWNGYQSPEQRWNDWHVERKRLRRTMLDWLHEPTQSFEELDRQSSSYMEALQERFIR